MNIKKQQEIDKEIELRQNDIPQKPNIIEILTKSSIFKYFLSGMIIFGVCFIICFYVFNVLLTRTQVVGYSMQPSINTSAFGEKGEINTDYVYHMKSDDISYKDIVIIDGGRTDSGDKLIKRVVGMPGQTITFKNVKEVMDANPHVFVEVYINDVKLNEEYIKDEKMILKFAILESKKYQFYNELVTTLKTQKEYSCTLKENEYFVMGDNRNNSTDSRYFGPITKDEIIGKVVLQIKPGQNLISAIWDRLFGVRFIYC